MKKTLLLFILIMSAIPLRAADYGLAYDNAAPSLRIVWNDKIGSELSFGVNYTKYATTLSARYYVTFEPLYYTLLESGWGRMNLAVKFRPMLSYDEYAGGRPAFFRLHDYSASLVLPEIEAAVPFIKGMYVLGTFGVTLAWQYADNGRYSYASLSVFGPTFSSLGIVYYFGQDEKSETGKTTVEPAAQTPIPAAIPAETPAAVK
jgi:hypothetical protein